MLVQTVIQGVNALQQADNDIQAFQKQVDIPSNPIHTVTAMYAITNNIMQEILAELGSLQGLEPNDPLSAPDLAALATIKHQIIDGRAVVGAAITAADWSLGGIFESTVSEVENVVSQAAAPFHVNWTWALVGLGAVVIFFIWVKVA